MGDGIPHRADKIGAFICAVVALVSTVAPKEAWGEVHVVCDTTSGEVAVAESIDEGRHLVMGGPFPGRATAAVWLEESCPEKRCDRWGYCYREVPPEPPPELRPGGWLVVCDPDSRAVGMIEAPPPAGFLLLAGRDGSARRHADREAARAWATEHCPSWQCDADGRCVGAGAEEEAQSDFGGWVAGEVTAVTLDGSPAAKEATPGRTISPPGPAGPAGPPAADLGPLVSNAKAAAKGCNFSAALASVDHMANFDPENPFYVANREKVASLAGRQRRTEESIWLASSLLSKGDLKGARGVAQSAADTAVSCQTHAVAVLLDGIDTAIEQRRQQRHLANRQAAAALLPDLVALSRAMSGGEAGPAPDPAASAAATAAAFGLELPANAADPCTFKYEYRSKWHTEPFCTCDGYRFDAGKFRCVR